MAEPAAQTQARLSRPMACVRLIGALSLLASLLVISLSVVGRHLGILLPGSVEIAEVLFVLVAATAMVFATVERAHAVARLILDRLPPTPRQWVIRCGLVFAAILWLAVSVGNLWLLHDVWHLHEATHLLEIPLVPFRIVLILATTSMMIISLRQLFSGSLPYEP